MSTLPPYLCNEFFQAALEDGLREEDLVVKSVDYTPSVDGGENYCSQIYRVRVDFMRKKRRNVSQKIESVSLIVKSMPINPERRGYLEIFLTERIFYYDVMPRLELFVDDGEKIGAKCFHSSSDAERRTLVFDDLTQYDYRLASRQLGLDEQQTRLVLAKLGRFHAASMILARKDPDFPKRFTQGMLYLDAFKPLQGFLTMIRCYVDTLAKMSAEWPGFEETSKKLFKYGENIETHMRAAYDPSKAGYSVLNHGDLWVNNFMFKFDAAGWATDVLFLDFQWSCFNSPAMDINFLLNSSVQLDVLQSKRDSLIETYYEAFRSTLAKVSWGPIPSLDDLKREVREKEAFGLFAAYAFLPMVAMKKEDWNGHSPELMMDEEYGKKKAVVMFMSGERTLPTLKYAVKRFEGMGLLD